MKGLALFLSSLLPISICGGATVEHVYQSPFDNSTAEILEPYQQLTRFLNAVDRGELTIYGQVIDQSMLQPRHVDYEYRFDTMTMSVKIYAKLMHPISVPELEQMRIIGVSVFLNLEGEIENVLVHVEAD